MVRIHHNTLKKAKTFGIVLTLEDGDVVATKDGVQLASGLQGNKVLDEAIAKLAPAKVVKPRKAVEPDDEAEEIEDDEALDEEPVEAEELTSEDDSDADQSKSVVKAKYKALYKPHKDKCGDDLSKLLNAHVTVRNAETGDKHVSKDLLRRFAVANDVWVPRYGQLINRVGTWNSGMAVMNCGNRLRAKIRRAKAAGEEFKIKWV